MTERRHVIEQLNEEELQRLVDTAVDAAFTKSIDRLILEISKNFIKKLLWAIVLALLGYVMGKHLI